MIAVLGMSLAPVATAAVTSKAERRIVTAVDRHAPAALELLRRTVDINSGTMNPDGVREVGRIFGAEFEALGFKVRWAEGAGWGRAGHLIATRPGRGGPRVLLIGHLDTVFEKDSPFQRYEPLSDTTARGPGICDMKGGDVIMLLALRALEEAGALDRLSVTAVLTGDEEKAGAPIERARADLIAAAREADVAIGFEDGDGNPSHAVISRRGTSGWVLRVGGTPAHSSQIFRPDIGSGSVYEAARILLAFKDSLSIEPYLTVNPGVVVGGTTATFDPEASRGTAFGKTNVIAESTLVAGDLRALSLEQRENAKAIMRRIVEASPPHAGARIEFSDGYPPLAPSDGNRKLLAIYDRASRDLGVGPVEAVDPSRAGAADVSFTEGHVTMAIDGVGMRGDFGHTMNETADVRWLPWQAKRAALTLARLPAPSAPVGSRSPRR
ncbi:MAG: M20/M25/M40 family metallo-hydrolase [Candidatus Eiseniibacteriota bacterium]